MARRERKVWEIVTGATLVATWFLDDRGWLHIRSAIRGHAASACILLASGIHAQAFELVVPGKQGMRWTQR